VVGCGGAGVRAGLLFPVRSRRCYELEGVSNGNIKGE